MSAKAVTGCYDLNPFNFQKRWIKKATSQSLGNDIPQQSTTRIEQKLEKLAKENQEYKETQMKLMSQLAQLVEYSNVSSQKNKGRGKNTRNNSVAEEAAGPSNLQRDGLYQTFKRNFLGASENADQASELSYSIIDGSDNPPPPPSPIPSLPGSTRSLRSEIEDPVQKTTVYVVKLSLFLNGDMVDQLESTCTKDQGMADFVRLYNTCGMANSLHSMHINYDAFLNGCFICAYDLSSSGICGSSYALPTVKTG